MRSRYGRRARASGSRGWSTGTSACSGLGRARPSGAVICPGGVGWILSQVERCVSRFDRSSGSQYLGVLHTRLVTSVEVLERCSKPLFRAAVPRMLEDEDLGEVLGG